MNTRQSAHRLEAWVDECYSVLKNADDMLDRIVDAYETREHTIISHVGLSIAALGDYLGRTIASIALERGYHDEDFPAWTLSASLSQPVTQRMQHFCPNRIYSFISNGIGAGALWYAANLETPQVHDLHSTCSAEQCNSPFVDPQLYKVQHLDEACNCNFQELATPSLLNTVQEGSIALFTVQETRGRMTLALHNQRKTPTYVAISHVWADGHGNLDSNALPSCFLRNLQANVDALGLTPGTQTPIWMDTLCLPRHPLELRRKAVLRLSDIFRHAAGVLVIDSYLQTRTCANMSAIEILARISLSGWTSRLWTFSEGRLARQIWFQFSDTAINLHRYISAWQAELRENQIPSLPSTNVAYQMTSLYTATTLTRDSDVEEELLQLSQIKAALVSRQTSWQSDEALCLGAILELDLSEIIAANDSQKMAALWRQMPPAYLPIDLVFTKFLPKLDLDGIHWAPATLLGGSNHGLTALPMYNFALYATPTEDGLLVDTPSMTFDAGCSSDASSLASRRNLIQICRDIQEFEATRWDFLLQDQNGAWYTCFVTDLWHQTPREPLYRQEAPGILLLVEEPNVTDYDLLIGAESDDDNSENEPERPSYLGVFVTYLPSAATPRVKAHTHVSVNMVPPEHWAYFDEAVTCAAGYRSEHQELQDDGIESEDDEDVVDEFHDSIRSWVESYPRLSELLELESHAALDDDERQQHGPLDKEASLLDAVGCVGYFCLVGDYFKVTLSNEATTWCVD
ncbi:hypothetical protein CLAIMM_12038 [Cladophialophora immunda]|nr:hypothetical protein CLAIMM_12038 [Cladophialophora immunda]